MGNYEEVNIPIEFTLDKIMYTGRNGYVIARVKSSTPEIREYLNSVWKNVSIAGVMPTLKNGIVYCCTVNKIKQNPPYGYTLEVTGTYPRDFGNNSITTDKEMLDFISVFMSEGLSEILSQVKGICKIIQNEDTDELLKIKGIGNKTINKIYNTYRTEALGSAYLVKLSKLGFTAKEIDKLKDLFDENLMRAYEEVKKNIFSLTYNYGFRLDRMDKIFLESNGNPKDKNRIKAYIFKGIKEALFDEYRSYIHIDEFKRLPIIKNIIDNVGEKRFDKCVKELIDDEHIYIINKDLVTTYDIYKTDELLYYELNRLIGNNNKINIDFDVDMAIKKYESKHNVTLNEGQKNAVKSILGHKVTLLTGSAGCGKSFTMRAVLDILEEMYDDLFNPFLCCLSGKASKVLAESTGRESSTIHRGLEFGVKGFGKNKDNKIDSDVIIVDEISMVSNSLLYNLLSAVRSGSRVVFCGDSCQLLAIGFSNPIKDLTALDNINCVKLTQVVRQAKASGILSICDDIRNDKHPFEKREEEVYGELQDMKVIISKDKYNDMIKEFCDKYDVNNKLDYSILSATKKTCSRINIDIQKELIRIGKLKEDKKYIELFTDIKDNNGKSKMIRMYKDSVIMIIKNNYKLLTPEEYELCQEIGDQSLFNGNLAIIKDIYDDAILVECDDKEYVIQDKYYDTIVPGWSYSIHKSQGSTIPYCWLFIQDDYITRNMILCNEALYTGVSRAKKECTIYTETYSVLNGSINRREINNRATILELFINGTLTPQ